MAAPLFHTFVTKYWAQELFKELLQVSNLKYERPYIEPGSLLPPRNFNRQKKIDPFRPPRS